MRICPQNFFDEATISASPSPPSGMPASNLQTTRRDEVCRSPSLTDFVISGSWDGDARTVDFWGIWPGALAGCKVRVELFSDATLSTRVYDSGTLDVVTVSAPAWGAFTWGAVPWAIDETDRTFRQAPAVRFLSSAVVAGSFRITISNSFTDFPYFEARRIWLAHSITAPFNAQFGLAPVVRDASEQVRTIGAALDVLDVDTYRAAQFDTVFETEADRAIWSDVLAYCGKTREVVVSLWPGEGSRRERDTTWCGYLEAINPVVFANANFHTLQLSLVES